MRTEDKAAGARIQRDIYNKAMDMRFEEMKKNNPATYSTISWLSYLIDLGMSKLKEEVRK